MVEGEFQDTSSDLEGIAAGNNQNMNIPGLNNYEADLILLLGSKGFTSAIDVERVKGVWMKGSEIIPKDTLEMLTDEVRGMRYVDIANEIGIGYKEAVNLVLGMESGTNYVFRLTRDNSKYVRDHDSRILEVVLTKKGTDAYEKFNVESTKQGEGAMSDPVNTQSYKSQDSFFDRLRSVATQIGEIESDFKGDPTFEQYSPTIGRAKNQFLKIPVDEAKRLELESRPMGVWERKKYRGFSIYDIPKARVSTVMRYLAEQFNSNPFTLKDVYPLDDKFNREIPFSQSWGYCNTVSGAVSSFYNQGFLERTGFHRKFSFRLLPETLSELATISITYQRPAN